MTPDRNLQKLNVERLERSCSGQKTGNCSMPVSCTLARWTKIALLGEAGPSVRLIPCALQFLFSMADRRKFDERKTHHVMH
tara:strand:+ start:14536 stop:14778 length:243 start_codon:yes stop_codon:yes gene_type:complete